MSQLTDICLSKKNCHQCSGYLFFQKRLPPMFRISVCPKKIVTNVPDISVFPSGNLFFDLQQRTRSLSSRRSFRRLSVSDCVNCQGLHCNFEGYFVDCLYQRIVLDSGIPIFNTISRIYSWCQGICCNLKQTSQFLVAVSFPDRKKMVLVFVLEEM